MKKLWKKTIISGVIVALLCTAFSIFLLKNAPFQQMTAHDLANKLSAALHTKISVQSLQIVSLTRADLKEVVVRDERGKILLETPSVQVYISPISLWRGESLYGIKSIEVKNPKLYVKQYTPDKWNYTFLLARKHVAGQKFLAGNIIIENGQVEARLLQKPFVHISHINGTIEITNPDDFVIETKCQWQNSQLSAFFGKKGGDLHFNVQSPYLELSSLLSYLPKGYLPEQLHLEKATLRDLAVDVRSKKGKPLLYNAMFSLEGGTGRYGKYSFSDGRTFCVINNYVAHIWRGLASINEQKVSFSGSIGLTSNGPLDMTVHLPELDINRLVSVPFSWQGKLDLAMRISGTLKNPIIFAKLAAPQIAVNGQSFSALLGEINYANGHVSIDRLVAKTAGGYCFVRGQYAVQTAQYTGQIIADGLQNEPLFKQYLPDMQGTVGCNLLFSGVGKNLSLLNAQGSISLLDGNYRGVPIKLLTLSLRKQADKINILGGYAELAKGGRLAVTGQTNIQGNGQLQISGYDVNLANLRSIVSVPLEGRVNLSGQLVNTTQGVNYQFDAIGNSGKVYLPFTNMHISVYGSQGIMQIKSAVFTDATSGSTVTAAGKVSLGRQIVPHLNLQFHNIRLENLSGYLHKKVIGGVDGEATLQGTLQNPEMRGHVKLENALWEGNLLSRAEAVFTMQNQVLHVMHGMAHSPYINMNFAGNYNFRSSSVWAEINADDIDLARFSHKFPYPVSGKAEFHGIISGTLTNPCFTGTLSADKLLFNHVPITFINAKCFYENGTLRLNPFTFHLLSGKAETRFQTNFQAGVLNGYFRVSDIPVEAITKMINFKNVYLTGKFNGQVSLTGNYINPHFSFTGNIVNGSVKKYPIKEILVDVSYYNHILQINKLYGEQGQGKIALQGSWDTKGPLNMVFSTQGLSAGLLTNLFDYDFDTRGTVNAYAKIMGTAQNPQADVSLEVQNGGIGADTFDKLTGLLNLRNHVVNINQILVTKGQYQMGVSGKVPLAALEDKGWQVLPDYQQINVDVNFGNANLSILPLLTKQVVWGSGPLKGHLKINGTLKHPLFYGFVNIQDGAIKLKSLEKPIENINTFIRFNHDDIQVENCTGNIGKGNYNLQGSMVDVMAPHPTYNFSLNLHQLQIGNPYYNGPLEGNLTLTNAQYGGQVLPKLSGSILLKNVTLNLPSLSNTSQFSLPNIILAVDVLADRDVQLYNPMLYNLTLGGKVHFGGTTLHPHTTGEIDILRGNVHYMKTFFNVKAGSALYFNQFESFLPSINLKAECLMPRIKLYLALTGPVENIKFSLTSNPPMNQEELLKMLLFQGNYQPGQDLNGRDINQLATLGLQIGLLNELEGKLRNSLHLDEFRIVQNSSNWFHKNDTNSNNIPDRENYSIEVGKYLSNKLLLTYASNINNSDYTYGMQYYFDNNISLYNQWNNQHGYSVFLEANIRF